MLPFIFKSCPLPPVERVEHAILNLQFMHALMVASEDLLIEAGMHEEVEEEHAHAEWLARDLKALGVTVGRYDYDAASIVGAQYYFIKHRSPLLLLGYRAALECQPMPIAQVEVWEAEIGPLSCLRHHAVHDVAHGKKIRAEIESITDAELQREIYLNTYDTVARIAGVLRARFAACPREKEMALC